jgi:transcriptional regulator with XRE-family HTH domain
MSISQQLRDYLTEACDNLGVNEVARQSQLSSPQISRIRSGGRGFSVATLDQIGDYLGLALVRVDRTKTADPRDEIALGERRRARASAEALREGLTRLLAMVEDMQKRL